ncbi:hypothetical protein L1887_17917 [Cichorium endivia]|nr:hypothetical protein L1887_17917 [Cichorium endivia]
MVRFFTGFSLATFVSNEFWMSSMFSPRVVGTANGLSGGWGNLGGGATQLIMPLVYSLIHTYIGSTKFIAWRIAFLVPTIFQTLSAFAIFFLGQDVPDGNYARLENSGGWILALTYGYCFGVELTIDNIIAQYFYDRFNANLHTAGIIATSFGPANLFSRPGGGMLADLVAKRFGMRGRLWTLWVVQMAGGLLCLLLGKVGSLTASIAVMLVFSVFVQAACGLTFAFHLSWISFFSCFVSTFAAPPLLPIIRDNLNLTATYIGNAGIAAVFGAVFARVAMGTACDLLGPHLASSSLILLTAPAMAGGLLCLLLGKVGSLTASIAVIFVFSVFVQAACRLTFAFHLSWIYFFSCFVSTFAAPPLLSIIRDNLNLTATDIDNAGIAAVSWAVFAHVAMGTACDLFGPRLASSSLILLTAPTVFPSSIANSPSAFLMVRFFTGFYLATFVSTQF